jgi:hypothetical protein
MAGANRDADAYIIFHTLLGSVVMYAGSDLKYIDALFFASGCATQSGLNTYVCLISTKIV